MSPSNLFDLEHQRLENALSGSFDQFLSFMPGKVFIHGAASRLGMDTVAYIEIIHNALLHSGPGALIELHKAVEDALVSHLPARKCEPQETDDRGDVRQD